MSPATEVLPDIERRRLRALVSADIATAARLHAEEYQLITPSGADLTRTVTSGPSRRGSLATAIVS